MAKPGWIAAEWSAPSRVKAGVTTRNGGVSQAPYDSLNLAQHVGDAPSAVAENRAMLSRLLHLPNEPIWLNQVHGIQVCTDVQAGTTADACVSTRAGQVCAIMTADCLPVLLCDQQGTMVAAAHAGWRGMAAGVIAETVKRMQVDPAQLMAWLGPAIGPQAYEVGEDVRTVFLNLAKDYAVAFTEHTPGKWMMDLYAAARLQLVGLGITQITGGEFCTYSDPSQFYSYRRDGETGRMASLIWIQPA